jgi:hypothetical protein
LKHYNTRSWQNIVPNNKTTSGDLQFIASDVAEDLLDRSLGNEESVAIGGEQLGTEEG